MSHEMMPGTMLLNRYKINECIYSKDFSNIYIAESEETGKKVVIKEILNEAIESKYRDDALKKFKDEIKSYKKLEHENMVKIINCFSSESAISKENKQFIVMEYAKGKTLRQIKEEKKDNLSPEEAGPWIEQLCNFFIYLSEQTPPRLFHYMTPDHIIITDEGKVKMINFGLSRFFRSGPLKSNQYMGIAGYSAPEQYGIKEIDGRADMFGLGAVIYYLLTEDDPEKHPLNFSPLRQLNPVVSLQLARFVSKCLQMKPEDRFENFTDLKEKLKSITLTDNQVSSDMVKKKQKEEGTKKSGFTTQIVGKAVTGWKENLQWTINKYIPAKYLTAGIITLVIICIVLIYNFMNSGTDTGGKIAYLLENEGKSVTFMNMASGRITDSVETGTTLGGICISPDGRYLYVSRVGDKIAVINIPGKDEITGIIVKANPINLILSSDGKAIFTVNRKADCVSVIEISSQMVQGHIEAGKEPVDAVATKDKLYIANYSSKDITVIDLKDNSKKIKDIPLEGKPVAMAFNPSVQKIYVANDGYEAVSVIDTGTDLLKTNINAPAFTRDIAVSPDGKFVYAAIAESRSILIIDPVKDEKISEIVIDENIASIDISPDGKYLYICSPSSSENRPGKIIVYNRQSSVKEKVIETGKKQFVKMFLAPLTEK